jgi:hypothetical protein
MGPLFFTLALYLPLPAVVAAVAYEREVGVRAQMRAMGLGSAVYWAVTHAFWAAALAAYAALLIGAAAVARLPSGYRVSIVAANDAGPLAAAAAAWALNTVGLGLVAGTIARTARAGQARPLCSPPPHPPTRPHAGAIISALRKIAGAVMTGRVGRHDGATSAHPARSLPNLRERHPSPRTRARANIQAKPTSATHHHGLRAPGVSRGPEGRTGPYPA